MWILPKQLITSPFVVDTKGLDWDYEQYSQLCEKSLMSKSRVTPARIYLKRLKTVYWMKPLCSRTLKNSHSQSFVDAWTSYLVDSHVNPFQMQDESNPQKMKDTCSQTSSKESLPANQQLSFWKMSKESSPVKQVTENQFSSMSSVDWKSWITQQRQEYLAREKLVRVTYAKEFSSWPTPTVFDVTGGRYPTQLVKGNWRSKHSKDPESPWCGAKLKDAVESYESWPTPSAHEARLGYQNRSDPTKKGTQESLLTVIVNRQGGRERCTGHLNPTWVEWLMGVPTGWTELGCWETLSFLPQHPKHSVF